MPTATEAREKQNLKALLQTSKQDKAMKSLINSETATRKFKHTTYFKKADVSVQEAFVSIIKHGYEMVENPDLKKGVVSIFDIPKRKGFTADGSRAIYYFKSEDEENLFNELRSLKKTYMEFSNKVYEERNRDESDRNFYDSLTFEDHQRRNNEYKEKLKNTLPENLLIFL